MPNLTITVDEHVLQRARMRALQRRESVNAYLAEVLRRYADQPDQHEIFAGLSELAQTQPQVGTHSVGRAWTRDELYNV